MLSRYPNSTSKSLRELNQTLASVRREMRDKNGKIAVAVKSLQEQLVALENQVGPE